MPPKSEKPRIRPGITLDESLHALATEAANQRGITLSALIEECLRKELLWQVVSWWRSNPDDWPFCVVEAQYLKGEDAGSVFLGINQKYQGEPGFVSVAALRQGDTPRWSPPMATEED